MTPDAPLRPYRRRRYLVNRSLQMRFVWLSLGFFGMVTAITLGCVLLAIRTTLRLFELQNDPVSIALFSVVGWVIVLELILLAPLIMWLGIRMTHRVAGPIVRIRAGLEQMIGGNFNLRLTLRKGDAFQEVADDVNRLAEVLRQRGASR